MNTMLLSRVARDCAGARWRAAIVAVCAATMAFASMFSLNHSGAQAQQLWQSITGAPAKTSVVVPVADAPVVNSALSDEILNQVEADPRIVVTAPAAVVFPTIASAVGDSSERPARVVVADVTKDSPVALSPDDRRRVTDGSIVVFTDPDAALSKEKTPTVIHGVPVVYAQQTASAVIAPNVGDRLGFVSQGATGSTVIVASPATIRRAGVGVAVADRRVVVSCACGADQLQRTADALTRVAAATPHRGDHVRFYAAQNTTIAGPVERSAALAGIVMAVIFTGGLVVAYLVGAVLLQALWQLRRDDIDGRLRRGVCLRSLVARDHVVAAAILTVPVALGVTAGWVRVTASSATASLNASDLVAALIAVLLAHGAVTWPTTRRTIAVWKQRPQRVR